MKKTILAFMMALFSIASLAKTIPLYNEPKADIKPFGNIDSTSGVVLIYSPQNSDWIKVGDPHNGNVGWIKRKDIQDGNIVTTIHTSTTQNGTTTYQTIHIGQQHPNNQQTQALITNFHKQQQALDEAIQKNMQQIFKNSQALFNETWKNVNNNFPSIIIVQPNSTSANATKSVAHKSTDAKK